MRFLIIHPDMSFMGGGERLCCETIRVLLDCGHEVTLLSEVFEQQEMERFFGYYGLFSKVKLLDYPRRNRRLMYGTSMHLIHHLRGQRRALRRSQVQSQAYNLAFSTQDAGYIPDLRLPVVQWGYFPRHFPSFSEQTPPKAIRSLPVSLHYREKISRIGLVLAISKYSKMYLDREWKRPSILVYPSCNMVAPGRKRNLVVTAARTIPEKRLDLFWKVAKLCPEFEFVMLLTQDPHFREYSLKLQKDTPVNGRVILNPMKHEYHSILAEAKVYLHLMQGEHFGITIVEAMSASCVPVVHDSGGPREIVDGDEGFRWRQVEEVPGLIRQAIGRSPSACARQRAADFTYEKFANTLSSVFSELQAQNPRLTQ